MAEPAQPPPWSELTSRLGALLERLEGCIEAPSGAEVVDMNHACMGWRADVEMAVEAAVAHEIPGPAECEALTRCVSKVLHRGPRVRRALSTRHCYLVFQLIRRTLPQASERLAAFDGQPDAYWFVLPACHLIIGCSFLARLSSQLLDVVSRYAACLTLILHSGALVLERQLQHLGPASLQGFEGLLHQQCLALHVTLGCCAMLRLPVSSPWRPLGACCAGGAPRPQCWRLWSVCAARQVRVCCAGCSPALLCRHIPAGPSLQGPGILACWLPLLSC